MELQEIFDTVASHLLTQNKKSNEPDGICRYLSDDGLKCAVGCLLEEDLARELDALPYPGINQEIVKQKLPEELQPYLPELQVLQCIHDGNTPEYWKQQLKAFADQFNLNNSIVDNFGK